MPLASRSGCFKSAATLCLYRAGGVLHAWWTVCQRCAADLEPMQRALTLWTNDETAAGRRVRERNIIVYGVGGGAAVGWSRACPVVVVVNFSAHGRRH